MDGTDKGTAHRWLLGTEETGVGRSLSLTFTQSLVCGCTLNAMRKPRALNRPHRSVHVALRGSAPLRAAPKKKEANRGRCGGCDHMCLHSSSEHDSSQRFPTSDMALGHAAPQ